MGVIKVMDELLANKIAAGEVVEKVANVVKELVENSIDAGSTSIKVELIDAGVKSIKVTDNGVGMDKSDAILAFTSHATSKIKNENDLYFINTLGFRGEALPSIASVSEVVLDTFKDGVATRINIKGGKIESEREGTSSVGTTIEVKNIFYNTPARLKFLRSFNTELSSIISLMEKLSLSQTNISFTLKSDDREILKTSGSGDLLKVIYEIYGYNVSKNMVHIKGENLDFQIDGYVSNINISKSIKKDMTILVNGRIVNNSYLNKIIKEAYHTFLAETRYPYVVINIEADPTLVDVNIHPTKQDIKISKMDMLEDLLFSLIRDTLNNTDNLFKAYKEEEESEYIPNSYIVNDNKKEDKKVYEESSLDFKVKDSTLEYKISISEDAEEKEEFLIHPVGLAMGTYLFANDNDTVYVMDIHAANERINYEKYLKELKEVVTNKIDLLFPINIEMTTNEYNIILNNKEFIKSLGIDFSEFGVNTIRITSHPTWLREGYEEASLRNIFDLIVEMGDKFDRVKFNERLAINLSCKMSVKANTNIGYLEQEELIKRLFKCEFPYTCPHGRPTIIKYTKHELEKLFKRVN